ncbi:hypothetical protein METBIDRAFT_47385 [Metschnikowia bicuspidata var. bicuspidata NRRL YB-4993]|uniref:CRAL-TRIO domain-containing protein n=1 Tax=Metschnikowia bicuspidata var. bicuspidata NRRL YB-4993 TaxID=869754 RepID=A0A1A0H4U8_9ASCO|nr:hypothetical protein METBIDRAFT_47385 [Metschnikowia bicuspidata var. bicuspidata NRRL YB-4993]OBA19061.1 hypothetical protein METBIDRAFT_47385 [Metschnikowia bicuspidata var. bicuspidata NRRL YB-4993]
MDRIFYKTDLKDAYTGSPIYIFDTSYLPAPEEVDYDLFIPTLMQWLPKTPYVVILFSCGLNKINWVWGISFLKAFLSRTSSNPSNAENVHKIIAVHESWFVKSVSQIFTNFLVSRKPLANLNSLISSLKLSSNLLASCDSLSDLSNYVDITHLKISLNVYRHDYQTTLSARITLHSPVIPVITASTRFSPETDPVFYHHFYQIFNIVDAYADQVELLFHKPGKKINTDILFYCLMRNQIIWINDWDLNCVASCFKKILTEISTPLIDTNKIALPMKDDLDYTSQVFKSMMIEENRNTILFQIICLCRRIVDRGMTTKHTNVSILRCLSHALTHKAVSHQNKDTILIVVRFVKNLIHHWHEIKPQYQNRFKTVHEIVCGEDMEDATIDELYNMSYGVKMGTGSSSDEDESLKPNTENLLSSVSSFKKPDSLVSCRKLDVDIHSRNESPVRLINSTLVESCTKSSPSHDLPLSGSIELHSVDMSAFEDHPFGGNIDAKSRQLEKSSIQIQFPPQKYKFEKSEGGENSVLYKPTTKPEEAAVFIKKPVIRGRKVGELTRIFEERSHAMKILGTM